MTINRTIAVIGAAILIAAGSARAEDTTTTTTETPATTTTTTTETPTPERPMTDPMTDPTVNDTDMQPGNVPVAPVVNNQAVIVPPETPTATRSYEWQPATRIGIGLMAGGGVADFAESNARSVTSTAGTWNVRGVVGTRGFVALEAAYIGTAQNIDSLGLENDAKLLGSGAEGDIRVQAPLVYRGTLLEPYAFAGLGWQRLSIVDSPVATASISDNDDVLTVPFGAGFGAGYRGFLADVRFTYRPTYYDNLLAPSGGGSLTTWNVGAQLGYEF